MAGIVDLSELLKCAAPPVPAAPEIEEQPQTPAVPSAEEVSARPLSGMQRIDMGDFGG